MRSGHVRFHQALDSIMVDIDTLKPHPENANNGDVEAIIESILTNGFYPQPLVVDSRNGEIIIGNHRYFALKELGSEVAPVFPVDSDEEIEILRIMLADNRINDLRRYDMGQLKALLTRIQNTQGGLKGTGFADGYLEKLAEADERAKQNLEAAHSKAEPVPVTGNQIMFLEVSAEDRQLFYDLTTGSSDSARFKELLTIALEA